MIFKSCSGLQTFVFLRILPNSLCLDESIKELAPYSPHQRFQPHLEPLLMSRAKHPVLRPHNYVHSSLKLWPLIFLMLQALLPLLKCFGQHLPMLQDPPQLKPSPTFLAQDTLGTLPLIHTTIFPRRGDDLQGRDIIFTQAVSP